MAGIELIYQANNVPARLNRLVKFDPAEMLDEIGQALVSSTTLRFKRSVDPAGMPWLELADATKTERRGSTPKPLVDRGHLRDSITHRVSGDEVVVGTNMIYGAIHQFGGKAGRGKKVTIPARPYLGISRDDEAEINDIAQHYIDRAIGA